MAGCIAEEDLLDLARGRRPLGDAPEIEAHLASCSACSALLAALLSDPSAEQGGWGDLAGRTLGRYRLDAQIGAGAMGEVYRARDLRLDRPVAVKVLSPRLAASPEQVRRLAAEGRAAASIAHPNIVTVHDVGSEGGVPYIVSELCEGESLRSLIERGGISRALALALGAQLSRGLAAAHARGVVHRDLKPGNLIVAADGTLKILDFGLARQGGEGERPDLDATPPGAVLGTAGYLAPEQARGERADQRSDLFAVGAILYEMLSGRRAFDGATYADRLSAVLRDTPPGLDAATLGEAAPVVARCLDKDPERRFQSAQDLAWALEGVLARLDDRGGDAAKPADRPAEQAPGARRISRRTLLVAAAASAAGGVLLGRAIAPPPASHPRYQQLTYRHGRIATARFTRDGGSVIYGAAWDEEPLLVYTLRLGGGGTRRLELPSADVLSISSRGELALCLGRRYVEGLHTAGALAVAPLEGGEPRVLADDVQEADFTPDGRELAVTRRTGSGFRIELPLGRPLVDVAGWPSHARVSPDGARVAYLLHESQHDDRGDVVVVERAGGASRVLSRGWTSVAGLAWAPDGRSLWFTATRDGANNALHAVSLDSRESLILQSAGRLRLHDAAPDGRAVVSHDNWRLRMMVRPPGASGDVDFSLTDLSWAADISADGGTLLFGEFGDVELEGGSYLRPTRGGQALRLGAVLPLALSPDRRRVLALAPPAPPAPPRVVAYAVSTGEERALPLGPIDSVAWARWAGDAHVLLGGAAGGRPPRIWRVAWDGSAPVPLTDEGLFGAAHVSPDGARAAFIAEDGRCLLIPLGAPGPVEAIPGTYRGEVVCGFREGGAELFVRTASPPILVRRVDLATGASAPHAEITPPLLGRKGIDSVVLSAAGDAYAYSYGQELSRLYAVSPSSSSG